MSSNRKNTTNPNKTWNSLAKFSKAVKKISNCMPVSPSSKLRNLPENSPSATSYCSKLSLYECSCEYHDSQRKELNNRLSMIRGSNFHEQSAAMHDVHVKKCFQRSKTDQFFIADVGDDDDVEAEDVNEKNRYELIDALDCASTKKQLQEVNERAEEFINKFWEDQRIQRQQSIEEFYAMLARGT